jgi:hypothetical protein
MRHRHLFALAACLFSSAVGTAVSADDFARNLGATDLTTTPEPIASPPVPTVVAGSSTTISGDPAVATVAFGHRRHCCGYGGGYVGGFPALYNAYTTYQPSFYPRYYSGYYGAYNVGNYNYMTPNPYGYYQNGWVWGSSGPTYTRPFPVWNSPSGIYDYRYLGWGSYGWGGWGGTGPAGWGYQGGFYW